jgi:hypothetical protein
MKSLRIVIFLSTLFVIAAKGDPSLPGEARPVIAVADGDGSSLRGGGNAAAPKALVVMLDGLRADVVVNGEMPRVRALMEGTWRSDYGCAWSLSGGTIQDAMTESAPNHISIATGLTAVHHGIGSNADLLHGRHTYGGVAGKPATSWLSRLAAARPGTKPLFVFSWYGDLTLSPDHKVPFLYDRDEANAKHLADILSRPDAPDAVMWYIDKPDHAGHAHGFYPYSSDYLAAAADVDRWIGSVLDAIASRSSFPEEDWLILVTADHGGWRRYHGMMSAQAYTIPFILAGRAYVPARRIAGVPRTCDAAPTALAHFGVDVEKLGLDGRAVKTSSTSQTLREAGIPSPVAHFSFDAPDPSVKLRGAAALVPQGGVRGGYLRIATSTNAPGCALLPGTERLAFTDGEFSVAVWVRTPGPQVGDPPVLSNKDWNSGLNPGMVLVASRAVDLSKTSGCTAEERRTGAPGFAFNIGREGNGRQDVGVYDQPEGKWVFYAATCGADGVLRLYQGNPDGHLYFISDDASGCIPLSGMSFFIGQDGTGRYRHAFVGDVDELVFWPRALARAELQCLFTSRMALREDR